MAEAFPLDWPEGWPREQNPQYSRFQTGLVDAAMGSCASWSWVPGM